MKRVIGLTAGAVLTVGAVSGTMLVRAAHDANEFHGCVQSSGLLRVVADSDDCRANETAITWNAEGPPGPVGPAGSDATVEADWYRSQATSFISVPITGGVTTPTTVTSVPVEAGPALVWGRVNVVGEPASGLAFGLQCQLWQGSDVLDGVRVAVGPDADGEFRDGISLMGAVDLASPGTVALRCSKDPSGTATALQPSLILLDVGSVDVTALLPSP